MHISDELPRLLTGDASRDDVLTAAAHLRTCADCQQDLVSAVVAHASLMSAHRFAPEIVAANTDDHRADSDESTPGQLPDLSAVFTQVREEAVKVSARPRHRQRLLAVAAAALVLTGGAITLAETVGSNTTQTASRTVQLAAYGIGESKAKVTITDNRKMRIDASSLPKLDPKHQYEVWLTDDTRTKMQPVGFIGADNTADLAVPSKLMSQYNDIEVSVQRTNEIKYSGTSVLRGTYG